MIRTMLAIGLAAAAAMPALAQMDGPPEMRKGASTDRVFADMAACVVRGEHARAVRLFAFQPGTAEEKAATFDLLRHAMMCGPRVTMMRAPISTWRGALAEAMYVRDRKHAPEAIPLAGQVRPAWLNEPALGGYAVAQCAAERDTVAADRVVRAPRRSPEEQAAVAALLPALRACSKGRQVNFDRVTIHGMVAEGLVRALGESAGATGKQKDA